MAPCKWCFLVCGSAADATAIGGQDGGRRGRTVTVPKLAIDGIVIGLHSDERYGEGIGRDEMRIGGFDDRDRNDKRDRISWI